MRKLVATFTVGLALLGGVPQAVAQDAGDFLKAILGAVAEQQNPRRQAAAGDRIWQEFSTICVGRDPAATERQLRNQFDGDRRRYTPVRGIGRAKLTSVRDEILSDDVGYEVIIGVSRDRCRISIGPEGSPLFDEMVSKAKTGNGRYLYQVEDKPKRLVFSYGQGRPRWHRPAVFSDKILVGGSKQGGPINLTYQRFSRSSHPLIITSPKLTPWNAKRARQMGLRPDEVAPRWIVDERKSDGRAYSVAVGPSSTAHSIEVFFRNGKPIFRFVPKFDTQQNPVEGAIDYRGVEDIEVDGRRLPSFDACRDGRNGCRPAAKLFSTPLDKASLRALQSGNELTITGANKGGTKLIFRWALRGSSAAIKAALQSPVGGSQSSSSSDYNSGSSSSGNYNSGSSSAGVYGTLIEDPSGHPDGRRPSKPDGNYGVAFANNTNDWVSVALRYRNDNGEWQSIGWVEIAPNSRKDIANTQNRVIYYHARSRYQSWGGRDRVYRVDGRKFSFKRADIPENRWKRRYTVELK